MSVGDLQNRIHNRRIGKLITYLLALCVAVACAWGAHRYCTLYAGGWWRAAFFSRRFDRVVPGMDEERVVRMLGPGDSTVGVATVGIQRKTTTTVTRTVSYWCLFPSEDYDVGYDQNGRVVVTDISPGS